jgi:hypothetical protein
MQDLPILTINQQKCLLEYLKNGGNKSEAYRAVYNCENMKDNSVWTEACKFFKNPKVAQWALYYEKNVRENAIEELNYSIKDAFTEFEKLRELAQAGSKSYSVAHRCIESKAKLAGFFKDNFTVDVSYDLFEETLKERVQRVVETD